MILVDENDTVLDARNIPANFHSSHNIIDVTLTWEKQPPDNTRPIEYRNFKGINPSQLAEILSACDWSPFKDITNIDTETVGIVPSGGT